MKILDRYILFQFLKTFTAVFSILIFIFILQAVWQFIDDLAGKDIDLIVILKFLAYYVPFQVPLLLPLAILVASIMTFGNFAENYEFAAMKSAGISLQRAMGSLIIFIVLFAYATFVFSNTIIPWSERKAINLKYNISKAKPSMAIVENVFSDVGPYSIKVDKKSGEKGQFLKNVIIHKKNPKRIGNYTTIKADKGVLLSDEDSPVLSLKLIDGNYYNEILPDSYKERKKQPFVKSSFEEYIINIDLSELNNRNMSEEGVKHPYRMMDADSLIKQIAVLSNKYNNAKDRYNRVTKQRNGFFDIAKPRVKKEVKTKDTNKPEENKASKQNKNYISQARKKKIKSNNPKKLNENSSNTNYTNDQKKKKISKDLTSKFPSASLAEKSTVQNEKKSSYPKERIDSLKKHRIKIASKSFKLDKIDSALIDYPQRNIDQIFSRSSSSVRGVYRQVDRQKDRFRGRTNILNKAEMQLHDKYALSFACVVLFFVGAPLGALIRKGGIGLPLVTAMLLFLIYHFLSIFAGNSAEIGNIPPFVGSWIATIIFFPLSIFMTYRATTDQGFGSFEFLAKPIRNLLSKLKLNRFKTRE